jgi:hypothetical protein
VKPASVFGRVFWHFRHEPCMMGWVKGNRPNHDSDHRFDSVWEVAWETPSARGASTPPEGDAEVNTDGDGGEGGEAGDTRHGKSRPGNNEHPTQKPVELFARPMRRHTKVGEVCFEPFSGSGTQIAAAEQLGRRCCAIELEPVFVDVAVRRWQRLTGREAVLEGSNKTWRELAAERGVELPSMEGVPTDVLSAVQPTKTPGNNHALAARQPEVDVRTKKRSVDKPQPSATARTRGRERRKNR